MNKGRAAARNKGAEYADADRLVFCDSDRFPDNDFLKNHLAVANKDYVSIGCPWDFFGNLNNIGLPPYDFTRIRKYSRQPLYYKKIIHLYNAQNISKSPIVWTSFLVGNSSVSKKQFFESGGFDNAFSTWGFEHFELAFRLYRNGIQFTTVPSSGNYHIPHPRDEGFYRKMIESSAGQLIEKYPDYRFDCLKKYLFGEISLQEFEINFGGLSSSTIESDEQIYYKMKK